MLVDAGSPPQVRGKLPACINCGIALRITPAGAGKTLGDRVNAVVAVGSPPQVRGKHIIHGTCPSTEGITPAGAGKTRTKKSIGF